MVSREHNDGVFVELAIFEKRLEFADLVIDKAASRKVSATGTDLSLVRDRVVPEITSSVVASVSLDPLGQSPL
jgi:hypothetical protein